MPAGNPLISVGGNLRHAGMPMLWPTLFALLALPAWAAPRLVSTSPAATETWFDLGLGDTVVGTVEWSDYPAAARKVPRVGPLAFPGLERIVLQNPSAVLWDTTQPGPDWTAPLARAGIPVIRWAPTSVAEFFRTTATALDAVGAPEAAKTVLVRWEGRWNGAAPRCGMKGRVLLLASTDPPIAFGGATFLLDAVRRLGFRPVLPGRLSGFASVGPDWLRRSAIDRVFWIDFHGPSPESELRRLVGAGPKLEALDADVFSRPSWTALEGLLRRFCREWPDA